MTAIEGNIGKRLLLNTTSQEYITIKVNLEKRISS